MNWRHAPPNRGRQPQRRSPGPPSNRGGMIPNTQGSPGRGPHLGDRIHNITPMRKKLLIALGVIIVGLLAIQGAMSLLQGPPDANQKGAGNTAVEEPANPPANNGPVTSESMRKFRNEGRHCVNNNGHHNGFKEMVRGQLPNATDIRLISTKITPLTNSGTHGISMEYHYRNADGNMVKGTASGKVDHNTCEAELLGVN